MQREQDKFTPDSKTQTDKMIKLQLTCLVLTTLVLGSLAFTLKTDGEFDFLSLVLKKSSDSENAKHGTNGVEVETNPTSSLKGSLPYVPPPNHKELAKMARYVTHFSGKAKFFSLTSLQVYPILFSFSDRLGCHGHDLYPEIHCRISLCQRLQRERRKELPRVNWDSIHVPNQTGNVRARPKRKIITK